MGLDMYAFKVKREYRKNAFDFIGETADGKDTAEEIAYWRKENYLHGWMSDLYEAKGGTEEFNCIPLELNLADLDDLEEAINNRTLRHTTGFFFGGDWTPNYDSYQTFIEEARQAIRDGYCIYYYCWW